MLGSFKIVAVYNCRKVVYILQNATLLIGLANTTRIKKANLVLR